LEIRGTVGAGESLEMFIQSVGLIGRVKKKDGKANCRQNQEQPTAILFHVVTSERIYNSSFSK
jgi:hypothetical protein